MVYTKYYYRYVMLLFFCLGILGKVRLHFNKCIRTMHNTYILIKTESNFTQNTQIIYIDIFRNI